jgi:ferrous iron transport protein B
MALCCKKRTEAPLNGNAGKVVLVGNPNVGKNVLFNALTGAYVTVSNYPGTSVEVSRGSALNKALLVTGLLA